MRMGPGIGDRELLAQLSEVRNRNGPTPPCDEYRSL
jgi:hypothetical protein